MTFFAGLEFFLRTGQLMLESLKFIKQVTEIRCGTLLAFRQLRQHDTALFENAMFIALVLSILFVL